MTRSRFLRTVLLVLAGLTGVATAAAADPLQIKDMEGRTITLEKPAERIVSIPIPLASTVIALSGGVDRLVGMHPLSKSAIEESILGMFFPAAKEIESSILTGASPEGFAPNVEAIAALQPDLVMQWGGRGEDIVAPLENAGLRTGLVTYGGEEQARDMIAFVGSAIGADDKARELLAWRAEVWAAIAKSTDSLTPAERPKVIYLLRARNEFRVAGAGTYYDAYIRLAGGTNPAAELSDFKSVNREQLALWDPDVILLNNFEEGLDLSVIHDDPIVSATTAAREKRVYRMPIGGYRWDPPSQESPLTWLWLATLLHPDRFDFDLRAEVREWYPKIYGKQPSEADIDGILRIDMNGESAGYERFAAR